MMNSSLLSNLGFETKYSGTEIKDITNEDYKNRIKQGNDEIRKKQQQYYEAYNNASKVSVG